MAGHTRSNINRKRNLQITLLLAVASFILCHLLFRYASGVFETWNAQAIDRLFLFRSNSSYFQPAYDDTVVHVDLNNSSIQRLDRYQLNRTHHARAISNLADMGVSVQAYDFLFAARSTPAEDQALIEAVENAGNVCLGLAFRLKKTGFAGKDAEENPDIKSYLGETAWPTPLTGDPSSFFEAEAPLITFPSLASASSGLGYMNITIDPDGVFRRVPLLVRYNGAFYPSLSFRAVCAYLKVPPERIVVNPGIAITLKRAKKPGSQEERDIVIPIDPQGNMPINFIGPWGRMKHYNFSDILLASRDRDEMDLWREELSGKIVVISEVTTGSTDLGPVPTDSSFPLSGIHSNVINTILTGEFLREVPVLVMMMIEILLLGVVVLLSLRFTPLYFSLSILCIGVLYAGAASAAFLYANTIMHLIRPLLMLAFALIAVVVFRYFTEEREKLEGLRQRDFIRATFGRFLSNEVVEELLGTPGALEMNGEIREVTFLVSDLRGFTALSTVLSPREVINILNRYLEQMVDIISRYGGTVNDFQGDGIIAFFGAPLHEEDDPQRAVACALAMQNAMGPFNEDQRRRGLPELAMGIGINGGEVVVGNIGSEKRAKYSAIGTPINMAYRIEANTVGGQILISPETFEKVSSQVDVRGTLTAQFKGIDRPVNLYEICGIQGRYKTALAEKPDDSVAPITSPLSVKCFVLKGKTVSEDVIMGRILGIGRSSAEIALESPVAVLANVKLELVTEDGSGFPEMYAKVMSVEQTDAASSKFKARMEFTWLPRDVAAYFEKKRI
ncbi:MAG: adenylate/guanylate cyclase domain-containing protein [Deltaproteobacteria bacterium]|nr:adenylate/guanylate cyclase domain-containing protein [Deltaproteobacteria bacterium]